MAHELPKYTKDHQVGMKVPKGGSDCAKCEYIDASGTRCGQKDFVKWNGGPVIPAPDDEYCCDFFTTRERKRTAKELRREK